MRYRYDKISLHIACLKSIVKEFGKTTTPADALKKIKFLEEITAMLKADCIEQCRADEEHLLAIMGRERN